MLQVTILLTINKPRSSDENNEVEFPRLLCVTVDFAYFNDKRYSTILQYHLLFARYSHVEFDDITFQILFDASVWCHLDPLFVIVINSSNSFSLSVLNGAMLTVVLAGCSFWNGLLLHLHSDDFRWEICGRCHGDTVFRPAARNIPDFS